LKDEIKKKKSAFSNMDANELTLYDVDIPDDEDLDRTWNSFSSMINSRSERHSKWRHFLRETQEENDSYHCQVGEQNNRLS